MAATAQALKTEDPRDRDRAANSVEVWKWLACSLLAKQHNGQRDQDENESEHAECK